MAIRCFMALTLLAFLTLPAVSETPGGTWGPWSRLTTATTGIETRVKCEYSTLGDSVWAYQFKNLNNHTVDVVEKEQHGLADSKTNGFGAAAMFTLEPGKISYAFEGTMHGTCAQVHNLKIDFVCVVPHGEDHPCFKGADGTPVAIKSGAAPDQVAGGSTSATKPEPPPAVLAEPILYGWCNVGGKDQNTIFVTQVFSGCTANTTASLNAWVSTNRSSDAVAGSAQCICDANAQIPRDWANQRLAQWRTAQANIQTISWTQN